VWNPIKRWRLRRSGGHCLLVDTDSFGRFRRGELVTAGSDTFMVIETLRLPPRPLDVVRRWEVWVVPAEQSGRVIERRPVAYALRTGDHAVARFGRVTFTFAARFFRSACSRSVE
jgi:hypothetical protein